MVATAASMGSLRAAIGRNLFVGCKRSCGASAMSLKIYVADAAKEKEMKAKMTLSQ